MKKKGKWQVLILLAMVSFVMVIGTTTVSVSISNLVDDLQADIGTIQSVLSMYTLMMAVCMLPGARLADIFGAKRIFIIGVALYGVGSLLVAGAPNAMMLFVGMSGVEGIAASLMLPTALSLLTAAYQSRDRAVAMSFYTAVASVAMAVGPILGGFITTYLSWRVVFLLEAGIATVISTRAKVLARIEGLRPNRNARFDFVGMALSMVTLFSIITGGLLSKTYGWFVAKKSFVILGVSLDEVSITAVLLAVGALFGVLLGIWLVQAKKRGKQALVDVTVFKSRNYVTVLLINFFVQFVLMGVMFTLPIYLQNVLQYTALSTGFTLLPFSAGLFIVALIVVKISSKTGRKPVISFGGVMLVVGSAVMAVFFSQSGAVSGVEMMPGVLVLGLGVGSIISLTGNLALSSVAPGLSNQASGTLTTVNNLGSSISTAVMGSLLIGGIRNGILENLAAKYPQQLSGDTTSELAQKLSAAVEKVQGSSMVMPDIPADRMQGLKDGVIAVMNHSMAQLMIVLAAVGGCALLVALVGLIGRKAEKDLGVPRK